MKKKIPKVYDDSWIYIFLLSSFTCLYDALSTQNITIHNELICLNLFVLPIILLVSNIINYKYDYKVSIKGTVISLIILFLINIIIDFSLGNTFSYNSLFYEMISLFITEIINLIIYTFLFKHTNRGYIIITINYILDIIFYYFISTIFSLNEIIIKTFIKEYLIFIIVNTLSIIIISIFDKLLIKNYETSKKWIPKRIKKKNIF